MSVGEVRNKMSPKPPKPSTPTKVTKEQLHKLQQAISDKNSHKMNEILKYDKTLVNTPDTSGKTPMHLACVEGPLSVVKVLAKNGADIDIQDEAGWSPLHIAASFGHLELVEYLLKYGSDPNSINSDGNTCLHLCVRIKKLVLKTFQKMLDAYLKAGGNINARNKADETILHVSILRGTPEMVSYLLKKGATESMDLKDLNGHTPLQRAEMSGFSEIIAVLKNNFTPTDAQIYGNSTFRSFFMTTPTSSQLPKVELDAFFWEFSLNNENTEWSRYDDIAQMEIEKAYQAGMTEVVLAHGFFAKNNYIVILRGLGGPMCQKKSFERKCAFS